MDEPIRIFLGYDKREAVGFHVCVQSILEHASVPVSITPVSGDRRDGTNDFVYSRFLVPYLCNFQGHAIFADGSDMLFRKDIAYLWAHRPMYSAVSVVQQTYSTRHTRKYVGTPLEADNEDYPRKNWSSLMLFNCAHFRNRVLDPEYVAAKSGSHLHRLEWLPDEFVTSVSREWNVLIGEENESLECAVAHFTLGIPSMPAYKDSRYADEWWETYHRMMRSW
jgi:hypothetical protein